MNFMAFNQREYFLAALSNVITFLTKFAIRDFYYFLIKRKYAVAGADSQVKIIIEGAGMILVEFPKILE